MNLSNGKFITLIKKNKWTIFENDLNIIYSGSTIEELCTHFKFNNCFNILIQENMCHSNNNNTPKILQNPNNKVFTDINESYGSSQCSFIIASYEGPNCTLFQKQQFQDSYLNLIKILSKKIKIKKVFNFSQIYKQDKLFFEHLKKYSFKPIFYKQQQQNDQQQYEQQPQNIEKNLNEILNKIGDKESIIFNSPKSYQYINYLLVLNSSQIKEYLKNNNEFSICIYKKNQKDIICILLEDQNLRKSNAIQRIRSNLLFQFLLITLMEFNNNKFNIEILKLFNQIQVNNLEESLLSNSYHDGYNNIQSPGFSLSNKKFINNNNSGGSSSNKGGIGCNSVPMISPALSVKSSIENSPNFFIKKRVSPHSYSPMVLKLNNNNFVNTSSSGSNKLANSTCSSSSSYSSTRSSSSNSLNQEIIFNNNLPNFMENHQFDLPLSPTSNTIEIIKDSQGSGNTITRINGVSYIQPELIFNSFDEFNEKKINWLLIGYDGKNLNLVGTGKNGLPELKNHLDENKAYYGVISVSYFDTRLKSNKPSLKSKSLFIEWLGKESSAKERAMRGSHLPAVTLLFKQKTSIHTEIRCDDFEDLSDESVLQKVTSFRQEIEFQRVINTLSSSTNSMVETII